ncbi:hypothetical protein [Pantoea agglomerans]|nr:hypothetical protein [Pantoea agglomerans]
MNSQHKADINIYIMIAPSGSPALPGRQPHSANRLRRLAPPDREAFLA